jgi:drug/metabolite transporter (DMT)-like permease
MALMTLQGDALRIGFGDFLVILSAVTWALHVLTIGHFAAKASSAFLSLAQVTTAALLSLTTFGWAEPVRVAWKPQVWFALGVTSLFATAFAFSIQTWAQQFSSPTRTALIFALEGIFAWLTSFVLTGELLTLRATFGAGLILTGILLVELNKARRASVDIR